MKEGRDRRHQAVQRAAEGEGELLFNYHRVDEALGGQTRPRNTVPSRCSRRVPPPPVECRLGAVQFSSFSSGTGSAPAARAYRCRNRCSLRHRRETSTPWRCQPPDSTDRGPRRHALRGEQPGEEGGPGPAVTSGAADFDPAPLGRLVAPGRGECGPRRELGSR
jgi:hypothetical protein